ncbi:MAG: hypothetical protein IT410_03100 [Candidatus Doudnabacteria bacterium]|nr:hypothetical protein [Candidatus Doudnabacteria bacterium]
MGEFEKPEHSELDPKEKERLTGIVQKFKDSERSMHLENVNVDELDDSVLEAFGRVDADLNNFFETEDWWNVTLGEIKIKQKINSFSSDELIELKRHYINLSDGLRALPGSRDEGSNHNLMAGIQNKLAGLYGTLDFALNKRNRKT